MTPEQKSQMFKRQSAGHAEFYLVRHNDPRVLAGVLARDPTTLRLVQAIIKFFHLLNEPEQWPAGPDVPPLCLSCDRAFGLDRPPPGAVLVTAPFSANWIEDESVLLTTGICADCAGRYSNNQLTNIALEMIGAEPITQESN